jgi:hypothetical protein
MALVNLKTQYTSLKFGNDQKGGGSSGLPYIKFDMGNTSDLNSGGNAQTPSGLVSVSGTVLSDFPKRGGTYPSNLIDLARIKAFLADNRGKIFVDKQKTLQFMNPKMETAPSFIDSNQANTLPGLVENTRVYSEKNLLEQVSIEGTGGHLSRVGLPFFNIKDEFYATTVGIQNLTNSAVTNRLLLLSRLKIASGRAGNSFSTFQNALAIGEDVAMAAKLGIALNSNLMFNYPGGPNSSYGVGSTVIGRYTDTTLNVLPNVMNYAQIMQQNAIKDGAIPTTGTDKKNNIIDFRAGLTGYGYPSTQTSVMWTHTMDKLMEVANPGKIDPTLPQGKPLDYTMTVSSDKINVGFPTVFKNNVDPWQALNYKDSIKLGFECLSNDDSSYSTALIFRALLSNGFTDNNGAVLNSFRYMGRGEEFHTYQGFTRAISFSFKIAAFSRSELKPLYNKLNYLISQVYPDYSPNTNIMRAPVVKITLGDYLYRVPGFLESVNVTVDNNTPWEINLENSTDVQKLPHVLDVSISFKPIHSILPQRSTFNISKNATQVNLEDSSQVVNTIGNIIAQPLIGNSQNPFISTAYTNVLSSDKQSIQGLGQGAFGNTPSLFSTPTPTAPPIPPNNFGSGPSSNNINEYILGNPTISNIPAV